MPTLEPKHHFPLLSNLLPKFLTHSVSADFIIMLVCHESFIIDPGGQSLFCKKAEKFGGNI